MREIAGWVLPVSAPGSTKLYGFHGVSRGVHAGTLRRYSSYCSPYVRTRVGSSYQCTNDAVTIQPITA